MVGSGNRYAWFRHRRGLARRRYGFGLIGRWRRLERRLHWRAVFRALRLRRDEDQSSHERIIPNPDPGMTNRRGTCYTPWVVSNSPFMDEGWYGLTSDRCQDGSRPEVQKGT